MRALVAIAALVLIAAPAAWADCSGSWGWEDDSTVLTIFAADAAYAYNVSTPVHSGTGAVQLVDNTEAPPGTRATPDCYLLWIVGLTDGDVVTAGFWCYDDTPSASPSGRIWAKYTPVGGDVDSYDASAGGNGTYTAGTGWEYISWTWTFDSDLGTRDGLCIGARIYSYAGDTIYVDDMDFTITSPTFCGLIYFPCGPTPVEDSTWTAIKALYN